MGESRNAYRVLVGRPEGKRPLGRPRRRWEDNIKMDLREVGYDDREWINLAQDRDQWRAYVRAAMNLRCRLSRPESIDVDSFSGLRGRGLLVGFIPDVSSATAADETSGIKPTNRPRPLSPENESEKSLATSDTTPLKMSAAVADETSGIKPTNRPRPLSPENESTSIELYLLAKRFKHSHFEREQRLRVFENKVLRKIFVAQRDEVAEEWRKLHSAELHALYSSPDIIRNIKSRRLRWAGHVARMDEFRNAYRVLVGRPERK
ncbi:hypothetical protein ANN_21979 [Periplaneta americana]|uniref:Uncharacterized protein n=1 Tax=Periplaneta americana TaxID=6978 RepID=A0ABQ8S742_PERAM|nr:hypothetical protein ANN_21979 [Periplaneta americana]